MKLIQKIKDYIFKITLIQKDELKYLLLCEHRLNKIIVKVFLKKYYYDHKKKTYRMNFTSNGKARTLQNKDPHVLFIKYCSLSIVLSQKQMRTAR